MKYLSLLHPTRPAARRPLAAACLAFYLLSWIGIPLPVVRAVSDSSEPFPCQHHNCGCSSAEQCWTNCCCMSMKERLAWAKARGIQPPASVLALLKQDANVDKKEEPASCAGRCCCKADDKDCGPSEPAVASVEPTAQKTGGTGFVSLIEAQRCRGASTEWLVSGAVLVLVQIVEVRPDMAVSYLQPPAFAEAVSPPFEPAVPPPRIHAA